MEPSTLSAPILFPTPRQVNLHFSRHGVAVLPVAQATLPVRSSVQEFETVRRLFPMMTVLITNIDTPERS